MDTDAIGLPDPQRVALLRVLDLDYFGAEIGELQAYHIARYEPRHVDDPYPVERARCARVEGFLGDAHRLDRSPPITRADRCCQSRFRPRGGAACAGV